MSFLTTQRIGLALRRWREAHKWSSTEIAKKSKQGGKKGFDTPTVAALEIRGKGCSLQRFLEEILPAYGIEDVTDFDLFLDYCFDHSLASIAVIKAKDIIDVKNLNGTREYLIHPDLLKGNRARISIITIERNGSTVWQNHEGHEFLRISKGSIKAEFAEKETGGRKKTFLLEKGDALAFPSALYHCFANIGEDEAELTIARPTKSLPKGMYAESKD